MDTLDNAARRAEFWKAEHAAANKRISELESVLAELLSVGEECDGWEHFPQDALDKAQSVLDA